MNKRIRELAEQADKWSAEEYHQLFLANESPDGQKLFREKFAELIVRECMNATRGASTGLDAFNNIKKHFGVE